MLDERSHRLEENVLAIHVIDECPDLTGYYLVSAKIEKRDFFYISFGFESMDQPAWNHKLKLKSSEIGIEIVSGIAPYLGEKVERIEYFSNTGMHIFLENTDFKIF